jgi:hypothetical protein
MRPCLCILVLLAAFVLGGPQGKSELMAADLEGAENQEVQESPPPTAEEAAPSAEEAAPSAEEAPARQLENEPSRGRDGRRSRRGIGADFWGGPYWGYGPRWGHPCESCRATCEADEDGSRCERCRVRCGW